jgi:uncharacterized protein YycO
LIGCSDNDSRLNDGDLIFQTSRTSQSRAIQLATKSKYSHMGVIISQRGKQMVYEAVGPVKYTPLREWIHRGIDKHFVVKRLKDSRNLLTEKNLSTLKTVGETFRGKPYDFVFGWSDEKMYCSELVWKMYNRALHVQIGRLQRLRDFDLTDPLVKQKLNERYPHGIPLNEIVISPEQMFSSGLLETIVDQ